MLSALLLIAGLILLLGGAKLMVDGVSALALAAGVPPLVVGLTVVAFGTSTPEVVINGVSAVRGQTDLAFGNIIGSCAINIGFVLAATALVRPLNVERSIVTREIPLLLLSIAALTILASDVRLNGAAQDLLTRGDGLVLLLLFSIFLYSIVRQAYAARTVDPFIAEVSDTVSPPLVASPKWLRNGLLTLAGMVGLAIGGRFTVAGAVQIAELAGVSQTVIGLTVVSFGTTLPELATCVIAARKGQSDLAIGNVVGSNIYNVLFIGGMVATVTPTPIPPGGGLDLLMAALLSLLLLPIAIRGGFRVTRAEGVMLLLIYLSYVVLRLNRA